MAEVPIRMGGYYQHIETGTIMRLYAASTVEKDYVELCDPDSYKLFHFEAPGGFSRLESWRGSIAEFSEQWEVV